MSGIAGIINLDGAPVERDLLEQMSTYMAFRGPDQQDIWLDGAVGFAHTLLRTTFESEKEQQPCSLDGQVWITADVRLDGRAELMGKLRGKGRLVSDDATDVELVLHAYHLWGEAALEHLMGDFAFGIWDGRRQRLFCAHDHFGVVPFYYAKVKNCLIFSNTLNCLRLHPAVSDELNEQAIGDFLLFGMNMDLATTTFADIQRLPPAHSLICVDGALSVQSYFQLPEENDYVRYKRPEEYVEHFRHLFEQAVADRLRTDHAATYLSGGMDSTSIAATAQKLLRQAGKPFDFRAYTIVYDQLIQEEEGHYAGMVADAIGLPIEYLVADTYLASPPTDNPTYLLPEPLLIPNQVAECDITARAASYCRVLFAGFGGDPLFEPVLAFSYWGQLLKKRQVRSFVGEIWHTIRARRLPRLGLRTHLRRLRGQSKPQIAFPTWLQPDFVARQALRAQWEAQMARVGTQRDRHGMITAPLWSSIFAGSDPGETSFPLRVRFPFFDLRLVRYVLTVAPMPWFENKLLLREAMRDMLPEPVRQRPKTTLRGNPHYSLIQQRGVQAWMVEFLSTPTLASYVDRERCLQLLQSSPAPATYNQLAILFPFVYWLRHQRHQRTERGAPKATCPEPVEGNE